MSEHMRRGAASWTPRHWNPEPRGRPLLPGQRSELRIFDLASGAAALLLSSDTLVEAPNWTPDGGALLVNAGGDLWLVPLDASADPARLEAGDRRDFNNDHLLSPDGATVYASSDDGHIYALPITGGTPRRVTDSRAQPHRCYLHGISPDGATLAYVALEESAGRRRANILTMPAAGGPSRRLTGLDLPHDGPEYAPDGAWLYFNSERASPGHSQCFRMRPDGTDIRQLTHDRRVNWFPHPSPDGRHIVYLSYPPGTQGHPADRAVILRLMAPDGSVSRDLAAFNGGQGTINVNSWAPDARRFAFVAYPRDDA